MIQWLKVTNLYFLITFILDCNTIGGNNPNLPCIFPFKYEGFTYHKCSQVQSDKPWCSTKVDENGTHVKGNWGDCASNCPKACHVKEVSTKILMPCIFPYGRIVNGTERFFNQCSDLNPENPTGKLICPTQIDETTGLMIEFPRFWGLCEETFCPSSKGRLFYLPLHF